MEEQVYKAEGLELKLNNFEGPLDLLLHLVKEAKIEIKDIFVSQVTDQFLLYMNEISTIDVDKASEYMAIAATLMEIKSHSLLPVLPDENDENSPEKEFIRNLEEYKRFKDISAKLKDIETVDRLYKPAENIGNGVRYVAKDMSLDNLLNAFAKLLHKVGTRNDDDQTKQIQKDQFSVADKIIYIQDALNKKERVMFWELFDDSVSKIEIVVTFSAMLELLKFQYIFVRQDDAFEDIFIEKNPNYTDVDIFMTEDDEEADGQGQ